MSDNQWADAQDEYARAQRMAGINVGGIPTDREGKMSRLTLFLAQVRTQRIIAARKAGKTLEAIGKDENIARERVRQILHKAGVKPKDFKACTERNARRAKMRAELAERKKHREAVWLSRKEFVLRMREQGWTWKEIEAAVPAISCSIMLKKFPELRKRTP
ncbi:MAG TPA: hypothetical protein PLI96_11420 [Halothiobacillus sp.]|nr:hypothetical protein [Halothiobacillus sp.]